MGPSQGMTFWVLGEKGWSALFFFLSLSLYDSHTSHLRLDLSFLSCEFALYNKVYITSLSRHSLRFFSPHHTLAHTQIFTWMQRIWSQSFMVSKKQRANYLPNPLSYLLLLFIVTNNSSRRRLLMNVKFLLQNLLMLWWNCHYMWLGVSPLPVLIWSIFSLLCIVSVLVIIGYENILFWSCL